MQLKTFRAESLQAALQLVRAELGPDASVIQTREVRQPRFGVFRKTMVEVEASADISVTSHFASPASRTTSPPRPHVPSQPANNNNYNNGHAPSSSSKTAQPGPNEFAPTHQRQTDLPTNHVATQQLQSTSATYHAHAPKTSDLSPAAYELLSELLERGLPPKRASLLVQKVCDSVPTDQQFDPWLLKGQASQIVASSLNIGGPIEVNNEGDSHVVALVGPTGVGKTTTLAKIAAGFRFDLGLDVGMITIDTFRLGAVDQLLQYAELISSPLEVVSSADQITGALQRLRECDVVLIDTAGRSPRDKEQLGVLADFLRAAQPDETHLVVSAASSPANAADAIQRFKVAEPTNLIMTKIDEAVQLGSWLDLLSQCQLPVSYITTGQHVPQDISVASRRRLASLLLGSSQHQEQPV